MTDRPDLTQAINITCDYCHALPGERCYNKELKKYRDTPHASRRQKLIDATKNNAESKKLRDDILLTKLIDKDRLTNDEHEIARILIALTNPDGALMLETANNLTETVPCPTCKAEKWQECNNTQLMSCPQRYNLICERLKHPSANCRRDDNPTIFSIKKITLYVMRCHS